MTTTSAKKLHLGCGAKVLPGFVNVDMAALPGVDMVHNLGQFPWPLPDSQYEEIVLENVLEHLTDTIATMEEIWRVARHGGVVKIRVPYWNSLDANGDPTHVRFFQQKSFNFFDPRTRECQERPYYSTARFSIERVDYWRPVFRDRGWMRFRDPVSKGVLQWFARYLNNIIWVLDFELKAIKL